MATMEERLLPLPTMTPDVLWRFWDKVSGYGTDGCWLWNAGRYRGTYGKFWYSGQSFCAHRVGYFIQYRIDPGLQIVCHECNVPLCIKGKHLHLGSIAINIQQSFIKRKTWSHVP